MPELPPPTGKPDTMGGGLNKKMLGLPTWGWIAISAAAGIGLYMYLQYRKTSKTAAADTSTTDDGSGGSNDTLSSDTDQALLAQIRDLQGAGSAATTTTTPTVSGLHMTTATSSSLSFGWDYGDVKPDYQLGWLNRNVTSLPSASITGSARTATFKGLKGKTSYSFNVRGVKGASAGPVATVTASTK